MSEKFYILQNINVIANLLWVLPLIVILYLYAAQRRAAQLRRFAGLADDVGFVTDRKDGRRALKAFLLVVASTLLIIALARPAWNPKPEVRMQKGRDVVFLLDVSKSMLAQDIRPSRLERSKLAIKDCLNNIHGDRVGLVVFAGNAKMVCPLTLDYGFFMQALDEAGPQSVERGGTMLADAIRKAGRDMFTGDTGSFRDIILITDGGDEDKTDDNFAIEAASEAGQHGVRIIAIGIGDEKKGQRIPLADAKGRRYFIKDREGNDVVSRLNANLLREIARASSGGSYVPAGTGDFNLGTIYDALVSSAEKHDLQEKTIARYEEKFQIFLAAGLALLIIEMLLKLRRQGGTDKVKRSTYDA
jgi:Ca-activated chloride channel family protein